MIVRQHLLANVIPVLLVLSLALLCAQVSFRIKGETAQESFSVELETLQGHPRLPQFQNRVLAPALLFAAREILPASIADKSVWYLVRFLTAAIAWLTFYWLVLRMTGGRLRALFAVGLVSFAYLWTPMAHPWEYTSDFFDVMFMALIVALALAERHLLLLVVVVVAALNRESAAFAGVVSLCIAAARYGISWRQWPKFVPGVVYMGAAAAVVLGVRRGLARSPDASQEIGLLSMLGDPDHLRSLLQPTGVVPMLFATALVFAVVLWRLSRPWSTDQRALLAATAICTAITFVFGIPTELRVWLPCWTILTLLAVISAQPQSDRQWLLGLIDRKA